MLKNTKLFGEFRSVKFSRGSTAKSFALAFALLMLASAFLVLSSSTAPVKAQTTSVPSNMLQYEWQMPRSTPTGAYATTGPAPTSPSIQWKIQIPGICGPIVAFNGLVFCQNQNGTYALDGATGQIVWTNTALKASAINGIGTNMAKIDGTYMVIGNTCVKIADGTKVWTGPAGFSVAQSAFSGAGYVAELKMFLDPTYGWNLPDPTQPPTLAWNLTTTQNVNAGACVYGDGKVFIGGGNLALKAVDAKTGTLIWKVSGSSSFIYGMTYADGKLFHGGLDNNLRCWDANTGKLLWTYNPGTWYGQWASSTGYAYGMVYEHNQDNYMYAINATTGKLVWRQSGPGIGYSNIFDIADGKIYVMMGESQYRDFNTGEYAHSEYDCFDAYTGKLIWTLPMENNAPQNSQCIAYGNLYVIPTHSQNVAGVWTYTFGPTGSIGEMWCIGNTPKDWSMFLADPTHSGEGAGPTTLAYKWKFTTGGPVVSPAACANGVVYFGSSGTDFNIYAVDAITGAQKWKFTTGSEVYSSVAVVNGKVYTGADDGNVYCLNAATGSQIWKTSAGGIANNLLAGGIGYSQIRSSPIVLNGRVYVGSLDGNLYCFNGDNGDVIWKFMGVTPCIVITSPTIYNGAIYFASDRGGYMIGQGPAVTNGDFYKLDLNGNVIWHKEIPYVLDKTPGRGNWIFASPTLVPELNMVIQRNGYRYTYAFNMDTGNIIWTYDGKFNPGTPFQLAGAPLIDSPLYKYGVLYMNDYYGIVALNATDMSQIWYTYLSREINNQGITYAYGRIYVSTEIGATYVLDANTGAKLSYYEFGTVQLHSAATPYNGNLYLGSSDWNMYCLGDARLMSASAPKPQVLASDASISSLAVVPIVAAPNVSESVSSSSTVYIAIAAAVIAVAASTAAVVVLRKRR
jgi:eukaryotic-like serine/threonine-protein kinase